MSSWQQALKLHSCVLAAEWFLNLERLAEHATYAKTGVYNLCHDMSFAATPPIDGTLPKYFARPEDFCYELADHFSREEVAAVEPLSIGVHVVRPPDVQPSQSVVVFGAGPVGLICCAVARAYGALLAGSRWTSTSKGLALVQAYAATHILESSRESPEHAAAAIVSACRLCRGADVAIDASGADICIQTAIQPLRIGCTSERAGLGRPVIGFPIGAVCSKELSLRGSFRYGAGDYELAVKLLNNGAVSV